MNTQAILKLIDKKIDECQHGTGEDSLYQLAILHDLKKDISSLPSLDIDSLQRYSCGIDEWYQPNMNEGEEGDWIKYDDLKDLLRN